MRATRLLLLRHGRTEWNADRRFQGHSDIPLDPIGIRQAQAAARELAGLGPDLVLSSDLRRAAATAEPLAAVTGAPLRLDARLREVSLGRWEGRTRDEAERDYPQEMADWVAGRIARRGGGELQTEVADRAMAALTEAEADSLVLVTHGGTAKALTGLLLGLPEEQWRIVAPLGNCHWTELRRESAGWRMQSHNIAPGPIPEAAEPEAVDADDPATAAAR